MEEPEDIDMTTSTVLPPAQNHDRQEAVAVVGIGDLANSHGHAHLQAPQGPQDVVVVDAMDTTPDGTPLPDSASASAEPVSMPPQAPPPATQPTHPPVVETGNAILNAILNDAPPPVATTPGPPPPADMAAQVAAAESLIFIQQSGQDAQEGNQGGGERIEEDTSDEDEQRQAWHPIIEDTSTPDENEMKEIEAMTEHTAEDRKLYSLAGTYQGPSGRRQVQSSGFHP
jgi:hypothetical protein